VGAQQRLAAQQEAVAGMALLDAPDAVVVELQRAEAEDVEDDAVVDEVLERAAARRRPG
jgi:hypothetical protein